MIRIVKIIRESTYLNTKTKKNTSLNLKPTCKKMMNKIKI